MDGGKQHVVFRQCRLVLRIEVRHKGDLLEESAKSRLVGCNLRLQFRKILKPVRSIVIFKLTAQMVAVEVMNEILNQLSVLTKLKMLRCAIERLLHPLPADFSLGRKHRIERHAIHAVAGIKAATELHPAFLERCLTNAGKKAYETVEAQLVMRIQQQTQEGQYILYMKLLEHAYTARDAERKPCTRKGKLDVDGREMRTVEDCDILVLKSLSAQMGDKLQYQLRLCMGIPHPVKLRLETRTLTERTECLFELMLNILHHRIGDIKDRSHGTVVALQFQDAAPFPTVRELHDVLELGTAPCVDALEVVTHDHEVTVLRGKYIGELSLKGVRILIFVHKHVQELVLELVPYSLDIAQETQTIHKKVVEIHCAKLLLALGVQLSTLYDLLDIKRHL